MRKIVICDDMELERLLLKDILIQYFEEIQEEVSIIEYSSGEVLVADAEEGYLEGELLFLDIYMDQLNGMETARKLRALQCRIPIVFLTASPDYAVESYEVQAAGYLLKHYSEEKLKALLNRILKTDMKRRVAIKNKRQYRYPYTDDIMYIDSDRHTVTLHMLKQYGFVRCHQSYLVNMDYIKDAKDDFELRDGTIVPVRVRGRKEILDQYYEYFVSHFGEKKDQENR